MHTNDVHPDGASLDETPARNATILRESYFVDRLLVAITSVFAAIGIAFGAFHAIGLRNGVETRVDAIWTHTLGLEPSYRERIGTLVMREAYPFDPFAPIYEQFAQFTANVLTWAPITVALLACGVLAVAAQRYAY